MIIRVAPLFHESYCMYCNNSTASGTNEIKVARGSDLSISICFTVGRGTSTAATVAMTKL